MIARGCEKARILHIISRVHCSASEKLNNACVLIDLAGIEFDAFATRIASVRNYRRLCIGCICWPSAGGCWWHEYALVEESHIISATRVHGRKLILNNTTWLPAGRRSVADRNCQCVSLFSEVLSVSDCTVVCDHIRARKQGITGECFRIAAICQLSGWIKLEYRITSVLFKTDFSPKCKRLVEIWNWSCH